MKMKLWKVLCLTLSFVILMGFAGCSQGNKDPKGGMTTADGKSYVNPAGEFPIVDEKIVLTAFYELQNTEVDMTDNAFLQYMEDLTNIKIDIVAYGAGDPLTKRNVLLASNNYPDIFLTSWNGGFYCHDVMQYGLKEEILLPLNDYIKEYSVEYKKLLNDNKKYASGFIAPNGEMYGFIGFRQSEELYVNPKMYIDTELLAQTGLDKPKTIDEFTNLLRAFKRLGDDVIPWTATTTSVFGTYILNSFLQIDTILETWTNTVDGQVKFAADKNEYREAVKYLNGLYEEGLIDPGAFTNSFAQGQQLSTSGKVGFLELQNLWCMQYDDPVAYNRFRVIEPVKGPKGVQYQSSVSPYNYSAVAFGVITDKCKYPEAAVRWFDALYDFETTLLKQYGPEGVAWEYNEDQNVLDIAGNPLKVNQIPRPNDYNAAEWSNLACWDVGPYNWSLNAWNSCKEGYEGEELYTNFKYINTRGYRDSMDLMEYTYDGMPCELFIEDNDTFSKVKTAVVEYALRSYAEFVTGARDINDDAVWNSYLADLDKCGLKTYIDLYDSAYQKWLTAEENVNY